MNKGDLTQIAIIMMTLGLIGIGITYWLSVNNSKDIHVIEGDNFHGYKFLWCNSTTAVFSLDGSLRYFDNGSDLMIGGLVFHLKLTIPPNEVVFERLRGGLG